jgi:hypothetical protein
VARLSYAVAAFTFSFTFSTRFEANNSKPANIETSENLRKVDRSVEAKTWKNAGEQFS